MQLYIDTANLQEIKTAWGWGVISGVTTNPSLVAREGEPNLQRRLLEIAAVVEGPISAEVISSEPEAMLMEARQLATLHPNLVIKIPITAGGLEVVSRLRREGIPTNVTLVFSLNQALLAARAGAAYVSPFVGRLDDIGEDGMRLVEDMVAMFRRHQLTARVIAASMRHPMHVARAALAGADIATVPFGVLQQMIQHPLTDSGITRFFQDWQRVQEEFVRR